MHASQQDQHLHADGCYHDEATCAEHGDVLWSAGTHPGVAPSTLADFITDHSIRARVVDGQLWAELVSTSAHSPGALREWEQLEPTWAAVRAWLGY